MRFVWCALACAFAASVSASSFAQTPGPSATATIHADRAGPKIDRHIFGQFAEHLGRGLYEGVWVGEHSKIANTHGFRNDVVGALRALHVPDVRWPGGCFADEYHWRDGIGPRAKRPVTLNTNWGGVPETNAFGTHEFLEFTQMIGADAYVNGNLGTGSPREMAEWLQYMTSDKPTSLTAERARNGHPAPWKIAYFAVGNEAWGCGGDMTPDHYADLFRQTASFLKAPTGARPSIIASGGNDNDTSWTETLISKIHRGMGAITFHYYTIPGEKWNAKGPATGFGEDQWISTLAHTLRMDDFITQNTAIMDKYDPDKKVAFAVDEWGTWYDPEPGREPGFLYQQNTLRDALVAALNFNIFEHHADRVRMANIAQMVNVLQAMILTRGPEMVLTPTYHVFRMFRPFQDATYLPSELETPRYALGTQSVPAVSLSAARTADGAIVIALVNLDPNNPMPVAAAIPGAGARRVAGEVLTAAAMDARNTFENPDSVKPAAFSGASFAGDKLSLTLPAKSVVVLTLE
ncbi:MAG TPA: alpha-L-arabinofuranosidase C-terminal domain-containing protein [Rhizomicrobium sp.]|nr:alpha-L-arabinofuranosidase C-terminal domain-containing protein [Rhizomicrobium sp.]